MNAPVPNLFRRSRAGAFLWLWLITFGLVCCPLIRAQKESTAGGVPSSLHGVAFEQKLNDQIPLDLHFRDAAGNPVSLGTFFTGKPVILSLAYYECPMLCPMALNGLLRSLRVIPFELGKDYEVVTVSFNPGETSAAAADAKRRSAEAYGRPGGAQGWHFLTGELGSIQQLTEAVGFSYRYNRELDQFAHATGVLVATPQGKISHYFYGIEYSARDLRLGLVEASAHRIGSRIDEVLLFCFQYDPRTGKYSMVILNTLRLAGAATAIALVAFVLVMLRRERKTKRANGVSGSLWDRNFG